MSAMRIILAEPAHAAAIAAIYAPNVTGSTVSFEQVAPDAEEMRRRVVATLAHAPWLVLEAGGEVAGYAYASRHRERAAYAWSVDVSVYVANAHRRAGGARALYQALFAVLPLQGFCVAHAGIALPNPASVAFHEACGFTPIGVYTSVGFKLGRWRDVSWWRRALRPLPDAPEPIVPLADVVGTPEWSRALSSSGP